MGAAAEPRRGSRAQQGQGVNNQASAIKEGHPKETRSS